MDSMLSPNLDEVISKYQRLAYSIAHDYRDYGLPLEDLRQESLLGLLKAFEHFRPNRESKFSTYAVYWIKKQILEAVNKELKIKNSLAEITSHTSAPHDSSDSHQPTLKKLELPSAMPELEKQILIASFTQNLSLKEIATKLKVPVERVKQHKLKALRRLRSLNFSL